ncbi:hypothetical protein [Nannocystis pusilla]|uniref:hypothetical protein n=1 Tax=Nannocystis pusilla TaxID=889268 RepID=UPI003B80456D
MPLKLREATHEHLELGSRALGEEGRQLPPEFGHAACAGITFTGDAAPDTRVDEPLKLAKRVT